MTDVVVKCEPCEGTGTRALGMGGDHKWRCRVCKGNGTRAVEAATPPPTKTKRCQADGCKADIFGPFHFYCWEHYKQMRELFRTRTEGARQKVKR